MIRRGGRSTDIGRSEAANSSTEPKLMRQETGEEVLEERPLN
jgi:hypothetical protein